MIKLVRFYKNDDRYRIVYEYTTMSGYVKESVLAGKTEIAVRIAFAEAIRSYLGIQLERSGLLNDRRLENILDYNKSVSSFLCAIMFYKQYNLSVKLKDPKSFFAAVNLLDYTIRSIDILYENSAEAA